MKVEAGLIGGTGVGSLLAREPGIPVHIPTVAGLVKGKVISIEGREVVLLNRHSANHSVPPHLVNYKAMALALKKLGARYCFASAAVGALNTTLSVGEFMVCSDFLDLTGRNLTLYDRSVIHTPFAQPFGPAIRAALLAAGKQLDMNLRDRGVYVGLNGPRFETPHEIQTLKQAGDVVGMTASSEAVLMKEAGIEYGVLAIVTNLGEGLGGAVEHGLVGDVMKRLGPKAVDIFKLATRNLPQSG